MSRKKLFKPDEPFKLSRSKLELFLSCPRCFYLDRKLGVGRPSMPGFTLNTAVDHLLKKEFDIYRKREQIPYILYQNDILVIPYSHEKLEDWRDSLHKGITYKIPSTEVTITGGVDDLWINSDGELHIVDYKATSKSSEINLDSEWQKAYKRQVEIYQYLFRKNDFEVSDITYFVYCNGDQSKEKFNQRLEFDIKIIPYEGDDSWVEGAILRAIACLEDPTPPSSSTTCEYCEFVRRSSEVL